ncbi:MAG: hypothetical protein M0Z48_08975 [Nitrospiraceae bacterium]|nr:hypothetical protein [Nitrospiraceae bacterium]
MKKLGNLSADQERLLIECADYWVWEALLAGDAMDVSAAGEAVNFWYKVSGLACPEVIIADSPMGCQRAVKASPAGRARSSARQPAVKSLSSVEQTIRQKMGALVWSDADRAVTSRVEGDLRYRVEFEICSRVGAPVKLQVWSRVSRQIRGRVGPCFEDFSSWGLAWLADWYCYYDFWRRIGVVRHPALELLLEQVKAGAFMSVLLDGLAVLARRPAAVRRNEAGELDNHDGAAVEWRDGCRFYFLNGIPIDENIITTPGRKLDPALLLKTTNAEQRREIVRKIGIERVCRELNAQTVDRWNGYELLELPLPGMATRAKYLKMRNPSLGVYHLEGVPPDIKTCREALSWRIGGREWNPAKLT